jgi:hypothetical protein
MSSFTIAHVSGRSLRAFAAITLACAAFLSSGSAWARAEFPGVVQETLKMECAPPCTICHTSPNGGGDTLEQPFYVDLSQVDPSITEETLPDLLKALGDVPCPVATNPACASGMCGPCDADGNGKSDIEDLESGVNPNTGTELACPRYGCGAHVAPERPARRLDGTATLLLLGAIGMSARRARRARR